MASRPTGSTRVIRSSRCYHGGRGGAGSVLALLPPLDREGRQRVIARCEALNTAAAGE
jgi:hypothetical protein